MDLKKTPRKAALSAPRKSDPNALKVVKSEDTRSQVLAQLVTSSVLSGATLKQFSSVGDDLDAADLVAEMKKAGDEAVAGDLGRVERMLANQLLTLDMLFNNLAQRSGRQESFKGIEVLMRLALKAQSQARATSETLAVIKNPMPYIKQANIAQGHQQVNNGQSSASAESFQNKPNKLLEQHHGERLDTGTAGKAGQADPHLETLDASHRATHA